MRAIYIQYIQITPPPCRSLPLLALSFPSSAPAPAITPPPFSSPLLPPSPAPHGGGDLPAVPPIDVFAYSVTPDDHQAHLQKEFAAGPAPPFRPLPTAPCRPAVAAVCVAALAACAARAAPVRPRACVAPRWRASGPRRDGPSVRGRRRTPRGSAERRGLATRAITSIIIVLLLSVACCVVSG
jgi:hypothetical protein